MGLYGYICFYSNLIQKTFQQFTVYIPTILLTCFIINMQSCFIVSFNPKFTELSSEQQKERQPEIFDLAAYLNDFENSGTISSYNNMPLYIADKNIIEQILDNSTSKLTWIVLNKNGCNYFEESISQILNVYKNLEGQADIIFLSADSWFVTISYKRNLFNAGYRNSIFTLHINQYYPEYDFTAKCKKIVTEFNPAKKYIIDEFDNINYNFIFNSKDSLIEIIPGFIDLESINKYLE